MPTYSVTGAHRDTGLDAREIITADTSAEAELIANARGILVTDTREIRPRIGTPDVEPIARIIAIGGSLLLAAGVFAPIIRVPIAGSINYFGDGSRDGSIMLVIAAISAITAYIKPRVAAYLGGAALLMLLITLYSTWSRIAETKQQIDRDLADNPFRGIADAMAESIQIEWGWGLMGVAALIIIFAVPIANIIKK